MKRTLIVAILALAANAVYADPTLPSDENRVLKSAPEATSFVADTRGSMEEGIYSLNP